MSDSPADGSSMPDGGQESPGSPATPALPETAAMRPRTRRDLLILTILTVCLLVPFAGKAFHIDDPFYIWVARQIGKDPLDFYGFQVNWKYAFEPAADVNQNPPLVSFYIYLVSRITGFSEVGLHLGFLPLALAAILGTYVLASRLCAQPLLAALVALSTPAFFVSATTVMSDMLLLACFVWAINFWVEGLEARSPGRLLAGGALMAASALSKYFGAALIPLVFAYSLCREPKVHRWILPLLFPAVVLGTYEAYMMGHYGHGGFSGAMAYATSENSASPADLVGKIPATLVFAGGCLSTVLFLGPLFLSPKRWLPVLVSLGLLWALVWKAGGLGRHTLGAGGLPWTSTLQAVLFSLSGLLAGALIILDLRRRKDPLSLLLFLWAVGTWAFGGFLNWTQSARVYLPLAPVVAILLVRQLESKAPSVGIRSKLPWLLLGPATCLSILVAWGDCELAGAGREAARMISRKYGPAEGALWFQGHWGFQYYMQEEGARSVDYSRTKVPQGDIVVVPVNNLNLKGMPARNNVMVEVVEIPLKAASTTLSSAVGAGFYCSNWGCLPFVLGAPEPERYRVSVALKELSFLRRAPRTWQVLR